MKKNELGELTSEELEVIAAAGDFDVNCTPTGKNGEITCRNDSK